MFNPCQLQFTFTYKSQSLLIQAMVWHGRRGMPLPTRTNADLLSVGQSAKSESKYKGLHFNKMNPFEDFFWKMLFFPGLSASVNSRQSGYFTHAILISVAEKGQHWFGPLFDGDQVTSCNPRGRDCHSMMQFVIIVSYDALSYYETHIEKLIAHYVVVILHTCRGPSQ